MNKRLIDMNDSNEAEDAKDVAGVHTEHEKEHEDISSIVSSIASKSSQKPVKQQVSIYLEDDIYKKYMKFGRKVGKGGRSELVNALLREALKDY